MAFMRPFTLGNGLGCGEGGKSTHSEPEATNDPKLIPLDTTLQPLASGIQSVTPVTQKPCHSPQSGKMTPTNTTNHQPTSTTTTTRSTLCPCYAPWAQGHQCCCSGRRAVRGHTMRQNLNVFVGNFVWTHPPTYTNMILCTLQVASLATIRGELAENHDKIGYRLPKRCC